VNHRLHEKVTLAMALDDYASPARFSSPARYLVRMGVFLVLIGFLAFILQKPIMTAFFANPGLNGLIFGVLAIGIILALRQVWRLFREIEWARNATRNMLDGVEGKTVKPPVLLAPLAAILGADLSATRVTPNLVRSLLDSLGDRLDETRDVIRYLAGLLVFLGLLGTFWGLLETVGSIGKVIGSMRTGADAAGLFEELKSGLAAPLAGMGISFSSSLFGLAGSLVLGFLDLQGGQAQRRFYADLEDWLASRASMNAVSGDGNTGDLSQLLDRMSTLLAEQQAGDRHSAQAMSNLAEGVQNLVQHMRQEQQMIRDWVEGQAARERDMKRILDKLTSERAG
jgi:hypothetical protein